MKLLRKLFLLFISVFVAYTIVSSTAENIYIQYRINSFKKSCTYNEALSDENTKFYSAETSDGRPSFEIENQNIQIGSPLDIIIKLDSTYDWPIFHEVISFTVGGHAALVCADYQDENYNISAGQLIETAFNEDQKAVEIANQFYWEALSFTYSYIVLRVNLTDEQRSSVMQQAVNFIGDPYNLSFMFNTKKSHYCSDLVSKSFKAVGINLNYDGCATTVLDLAVSNQVQIVGYKEYNPTTKVSSYYGVNL